jgi:hypothetical protein
MSRNHETWGTHGLAVPAQKDLDHPPEEKRDLDHLPDHEEQKPDLTAFSSGLHYLDDTAVAEAKLVISGIDCLNGVLLRGQGRSCYRRLVV